MVAKRKPRSSKKKLLPTLVLESDRLRLQLLNAYVDRSSTALDGEKIRMENARLGIVIAQRDFDMTRGDLARFGDELAEKYRFDMVTDSVDWATGAIKRKLVEGGNDGNNEEK